MSFTGNNITKSIVDCNEDMNERPEQPLEEKMAIPEGGGEDHMDVTFQEESDVPGYVSLRSKGPGKPISIRCDEKPHSFSHGIEVNSARLMSPRDYDQIPDVQAELGSQFKDQSAEFLDKSTRQSVSYGIGSLKVRTAKEGSISDVSGNVDTRNCFQDELEVNEKSTENEHKTFPDFEFRSQERVVSLSPESRSLLSHLPDSSGKGKYRLNKERAKKKIGMKKGASPRKEIRGLQLVPVHQPYPKWMEIRLGEIVNGQKCVNIDGVTHQVEVRLVPVDDRHIGLPVSEQQDGIDPALTENIHANGSKDRPPDGSHCLENDLPQDLYCMSQYGAAAGVTMASDNFRSSSDKPLDLTIEKPLDLSMKRKSTVSTFQGQMSFTGRGNEISQNMGNASADVTANIQNYRSRCSSVVSMDDRDAPLEEDSKETGLASHATQQYSEEITTSDSNLPSLGKLTLECTTSNQEQALASQKSGIQDSSVRQEIAAALKGKQNLPASTNVSPQAAQILAWFIQNQLKQSAIRQQNVPHPTCRISYADLPSQQSLQTSPASMQNDKVMEQDIPAPPIPNLQSLELANNEGGIFESEVELMKRKLKTKILKNKEFD